VRHLFAASRQSAPVASASHSECCSRADPNNPRTEVHRLEAVLSTRYGPRKRISGLRSFAGSEAGTGAMQKLR